MACTGSSSSVLATPHCRESGQGLPPAQQHASRCLGATKRALSCPGPRRFGPWSSRYVPHLRAVACRRARLGSAAAPGRGCLSRCIGLTNVASTATWAPRRTGKPLATTSMRRSSVAGTSRFMPAGPRRGDARPGLATDARRSLLQRAGAPNEYAHLHARGVMALSASSTPPQRHHFGANGRGKRRHRSSATPKLTAEIKN